MGYYRSQLFLKLGKNQSQKTQIHYFILKKVLGTEVWVFIKFGMHYYILKILDVFKSGLLKNSMNFLTLLVFTEYLICNPENSFV